MAIWGGLTNNCEKKTGEKQRYKHLNAEFQRIARRGTATIQHSSGSFGHSNQSRTRNKRNPNWKRRSKTLIVCT